MRDFLDNILMIIGAESMTDEEFAFVQSINPVLDTATYNDLVGTLDYREAVSSMRDRLEAYYFANGVSVTPPPRDASNIFIGGEL